MSGKECQQVCKQMLTVQVVLNNYVSVRILNRLLARLLIVTAIMVLPTTRYYERAFAAPATQGISSARTPAIVASSGASLYDSPGANIQSTLAAGTVVTASGRSGDNLWIAVQTIENQSGWVAINEIVVYRMEHLPVILESAGDVPDPSTEIQVATVLPTPTSAPPPLTTPSPGQQPAVVPVGYPLQTGQTTLVAVVLVATAGLYDRPGGTVQEQLAVGLVLTASGRSADGAWLFVRTPPGSTGWVQIADVVMTNAENLPILDAAVGDSAPTGSAAPQEPIPQAQSTPTPDSSADVPPVEKGGTSPADPNPVDPNKITATVAQIDSRLNVRKGPGTNYHIIGKAAAGDTFEVNGRNSAATWIQIKTIEGEHGLAWVAAEFVLLSHPVLGLPVTELETQSLPAATTIGDIACTTDQIIKWDSGQAKWVCSNDLITLQAEVTTLQAEVAALRAEIATLKE